MPTGLAATMSTGRMATAIMRAATVVLRWGASIVGLCRLMMLWRTMKDMVLQHQDRLDDR